METKQLLAEFEAEINSMDASAFKPHHAVDAEDKEIVIGECTETEQRLYALTRMYAKMRDQHKVEAKYHTAEEGCTEHHAKIAEYDAKQTIYTNILWYSIESRLNLYAESMRLGVRADWQIIKSPRSKNGLPPGLSGFIQQINGDE